MSSEDKAQELDAMEWARNNTRRAVPTYAPSDPHYGPVECKECDDPMPTLRREAGRTLCTECQTKQERSKTLHCR